MSLAVSIVVPVSSVLYLERLRGCLRSLDAQADVDIDLILAVLHRSEKKGLIPLLELLGERRITIVFQRFKNKHWLPSLSRNIGFRYAAKPYVGCLDADAVLDPNTVREALLAIHGKADRAAVRVRTKMMPQQAGDPIFKDLRSAVFQKNARAHGWEAPGPGCLIVAPRARVNAVRGWDERYIAYGPADWDYFERLTMFGRVGVNLTETRGIWSMHQHHEAQRIDVERRRKNRELYYEVKAGRAPARANQNWGALVPEAAQGLLLVVPVVAADTRLRRLRECCDVLREHKFPWRRVRFVAAVAADAPLERKVEVGNICRFRDGVLHVSDATTEAGLVDSAAELACGRKVVVVGTDGVPVSGVKDFLRGAA